jgi:hypothetical protein
MVGARVRRGERVELLKQEAAAAAEGKPPVVLVVSDALGETAELVAKAALSQFHNGPVEIRRFAHVKEEAALEEVLELARQRPSVIVHTLVLPELREALRRRAQELQLLQVDVLGPILEAVGSILPVAPRLKPGLVHRMDQDYFRRVEAIEFAVKYDDGKDPRGLDLADVVLVGVSRTSKTPVSMYLAGRLLKVANVPLVPEMAPPPELFRLSPGKVIGLTINPTQLYHIRCERLRAIGLPPEAEYASLRRIMEELDYAERVFGRVGCPVVEVSNKAVEETANQVWELMQRRG